MPENVVK